MHREFVVSCRLRQSNNDQIGIIDLKNSISLIEYYKSIFYSLMFNLLACKIIKTREKYDIESSNILLRGFAVVVRTTSLPFCSNKGHRVKDGLEL